MNTETLCRPVLIETAEQAEAMPEGAIAMYPHGHFTKTNEGRWLSPRGGVQSTAGGLVGYVALVPIEAEAQYVAPDAMTYTRYVTAWEEARPRPALSG